jgi:DNA-binding CsgD family transcriptional regulator/GAF domain-containing protein
VTHGSNAGVGVLEFAEAVCSAEDMETLERRCLAGMARLIPAPMHGFYELDPHSGNPLRVAASNVSDTFLAGYERGGRDSDVVLGRIIDTGEPAYNLDLCSIEEWEQTDFFHGIKRIHDIRQCIEAPIKTSRGLVGTLNLGNEASGRAYDSDSLLLAQALGRITGIAIEKVRARRRVEIERDQAMAALELTQAATVVSGPAVLEPKLNARARSLISRVKAGEQALHRILARPAKRGGFSRSLQVVLDDGRRAVLRGSSSSVGDPTGSMVTVLELDEPGGDLPPTPLLVLTPREREVALEVVEGHSDREIGERLFLSHHTVRQHVKQIYRKLGVDSRVGLTRLLLTSAPAPRFGRDPAG